MTQSNCASLTFFMILIATVICTEAVNAGVVNDPILVFGSDAIDPAGAFDLTGPVTGAATKSELTSITDFGVIQDFNGFTNRSAQMAVAGQPTINFFDFTSPDRADIRITTSSNNGSGGGNDSGSNGTSGTNSQYLGSGPLTFFNQVIEFGTYNSIDESFIANRSVSAAGFTITRIQNAPTTITTTFLDDTNQTLSTQAIDTTGATASHLFGLVSPTANIRRIDAVFTVGQANLLFDDLGFTTAPPAKVDPFTQVAALNSFNGSFEDTDAGAGAPTSNLVGSNGSFDAFDGNFLTIDGWAPFNDDPNNVVGRYGPSGFISDNSFYLDTLSGSGGGSDGTRRLTLNSIDSYLNGVVNEDVLSGIDSRFLNPNVQLKIVADVAQGNTSIAGNTNATATVALTDGVGAAATDLSNAIGSASVQQSILGVNDLGSGGTQLEFTLTGADLASAAQLNLVIQSVNTTSTSGESPPGLDATKASQAFFDNLRVLAFLPGDSDGDFDVDGDDLVAWQSNYGNPAFSVAEGDYDLDGDTDGRDFLIWQRNFTGTLPLLFSSVATVPEPNSLVLAIVVFGLFHWRRKC